MGDIVACELFAIRYATVLLRRDQCFRDQHGSAARRPQRLDFFVWLLRNPTSALVIDTGFSAASGAARDRHLLGRPRDLLAPLLAGRRVDALLVTHLHYDHTGDLDIAPDAPLLVAAAERAFWRGEALTSPAARIVEVADIDHLDELDRRGRVRSIIDTPHPLPLGAIAHLTPGHTPGQLVVEVPTDAGGILLANDAAHFYEELDGGPMFIYTIDPAGADASIAWLAARSSAGATVVPGHDPLVCERFPEVAEGVFRLA